MFIYEGGYFETISEGREYELKHPPNFGECSKRPQILDSDRVGMILKGVFDRNNFS